TLVLASTPDFLSSSDHGIAIEASRAQTLAQALAERGARADVAGDLSLLSGGKLAGRFVSGALGQDGRVLLSRFTSLATGTEILSSLTVDGNRQGAVVTLDPQHVRVMGSLADLTLVDAAQGALLLDARAATEATLRLADGVKAQPQLSNVIELAGPDGAAVG